MPDQGKITNSTLAQLPGAGQNNGAQFYTGNNFFVIKGVGSESPIIKIVTYTSSGWTVQDISSLFFEAIINDRTRVTVGQDYIVLTWRLTSADTWKIGIIRYKNGQWQNGVVMNSYAATPATDPDSQYETFTPFISGNTIFAEMYEPTSKLQTYSFTEYGNGWDSQQTNNLNLGWPNGYQNPLKPFIQPGSNFSVCVIDQSLQYQGDGQLLAWKKTYGDDPSTSIVDFREVFTDALSGGYDYIVATKKVSDGMGNIIQTNFQFEKGVYDDNISSVKYNKATETPSGSNGKTVSYFYNDKGLGDAEDFVNVPNYQVMDGLQYKKKIFENGGATPFSEITNTWSVQAVGISYGNERLDPIETHTAATWVTVPSGAIHQVIDDGDILNTGDYTYSVNPDLFTVRLQPMLNSPSPTGYCVITADVKPHYSGQDAMFYLVLWQWNGTGLSFIAEQNIYLPETQQNYSAVTLTVSNSSISNPGQLYVSVDCLISTVDVARIKANVDFQVDKGIYHRRMIQEVAAQDGVQKTSTYEYSNLNGLVSRFIETNSDGTQRFTRMKYPLDYPNTSGSSSDLMVQALDDMKNGKHIHNAVIERLVSGLKPGDVEKLISASLTKYKRYGTSQVLASHELNVKNPDPIVYSGFTQSSSTTSAFAHDSRYIAANTFDLYDTFGNSLQVTNANGAPTSTKWALNSVVPVATFVNASNAQSFFDEFGDGNYTGWSIVDNNTQNNTQYAIENGMLKRTNPGSASSEEHDRIQYDLGTEITGKVIMEFDLRIADSNSWDLTIGIGGSAWTGGHPGTEQAVFTAMNNETWYNHDPGGWSVIKSGLIIGKTYHVRLIADCSALTVDFYIDGARVRQNAPMKTTTTGIQKIAFGRYGYNSLSNAWYIDNVRLYPAAGLASSQSFDPITLNVTQEHSENGIPTYYEYDSFRRLTREVSFDNRVIKEHSYYDSRVGNSDVFSSSDPNSEGLVEYADGLSKDGLAGYWRLEGNAKDESGNGNNGTFYGNAASKRGYSGSGLLLDGSGDWVGSPHSSSLNISGGSITLSAWVKFGVANNLRFIVEKMANTGRQYYMWWSSSAGIVAGYHDGTVFRDYIYAWVPTVGTWYHLAWTANGSNVRIYVNSVMVASYAQTGNLQNTTTGNCDIGRNAGGAYYFSGSIDEVRIYKRALSEAEIKSQYNARVVSNFADGIGREIQNQVILGNTDIVTQMTYDLLGRKSKGYKSYLVTLGGNAHKYDPNYVTNSNAYYSQDAGYPYAEMQYRAEPTSRPQKQGDPGTNHRIGSGNELKTDFFSEVATGRLKARQTDEDGKSTYNYTDKFGNVVRTVVDSVGLNLATHFEYDVLGKMTKAVTPSGLASIYTYNTMQQLRQKVSPDAGTWSYLYDQMGNLRLITDGRGMLIYKKYDAHNRVIEEGRYTGSGSNFTQTNANTASFPTSPILLEKTFSYDLPTTDALASNPKNVSGRIAAANSYDAGTWKWTTFYSYNELGFVEWVVQKNAWGKAWKITHDRDIQGREAKKGFADSYNGYNLYTFTEYDMAGRIKKVSTNAVDDPITATKEAEYTHTATNKPSNLILGNTAQTITYSYNERDFVKTIASARFTQTLYYHDTPPFTATTQKNGNIAAMSTNYAALGQMGFGYTYDNANRLTVAQTWLNSGSWAVSNNFEIATIGYNGAGNITAMQRYGFNGSIMDNLTYNYVGGTNRLNYITDAVASGSFTTDIDNQTSGNYSYDGNGSVLQDLGSGITSISYGIRNLPYGLVKNSIAYAYNYDAADSRVYSSESNRFYVNGADGKTEAVVDVANNALITHNIWGNDLVGQVKRNGGLTRFYHLKDHLGSIRVTVDVAGIDVARDDYDAWGMLLETRSYNAGLADARYKFTGKEKDPQTGLDYFGARYYDSRIARWMSVDPMATLAPDRTPYHYTSNNPINRIDLDGRIDWPLKGNAAVNKRDYRDGARNLTNTIVRTSTYLDTDRPLGATNPHIGVDYRANVGDAFYSLGDGTVREIGETGGGAKYVTVEYGNGDRVRFLHINKVSDGIKIGHVVFEGELLGETGKTGTKTEHLHIDATDKKGNQIDPEKTKYGSASNKEFFEKFGGDYQKLKQVKDLERGKKGQQTAGLVPAAF